MFSKTTTGLVALTILSDEVLAMKLKYRPLAGTAPWHKDAEANSWVKPTWDVDYFVPNFGLDKDIKVSLDNVKTTEAKLGHKLAASFEKPKGHPTDYYVPNFGLDKDIKVAQANLEETEKDLGSKLSASFEKPKGHPTDYFVPNFGLDHTVKVSLDNVEETEKELGHELTASFKKPKGHPVDYYVPNFGLDHDILTAQKNIKDQEKKHGVWTPKQDDNGVWQVPTAAPNSSYTYRLLQLDSQIDLQDDPICSSAGCTQYQHKKKKPEYPIDYPVPNFGGDHSIAATDESL